MFNWPFKYKKLTRILYQHSAHTAQ